MLGTALNACFTIIWVIVFLIIFAAILKIRRKNKSPKFPHKPTEKPNKATSENKAENKADAGLTREQEEELRESLKKDENGKYIFDSSKPYGSVENPVVVGMSEYSTVLIYDRAKKRWILTDGLGNGWIR